jgi:hypothetical protein
VPQASSGRRLSKWKNALGEGRRRNGRKFQFLRYNATHTNFGSEAAKKQGGNEDQGSDISAVLRERNSGKERPAILLKHNKHKTNVLICQVEAAGFSQSPKDMSL